MSDPIDDGRTDEDRAISDVGLPGPGDDMRTDGAGAALGERDVDVDGQTDADRAALDEVFPPGSAS